MQLYFNTIPQVTRVALHADYIYKIYHTKKDNMEYIPTSIFAITEPVELEVDTET